MPVKQAIRDSEVPLTDAAYNKIKQSIISGKYSQGSNLQQLVLSKELGISRTPIREALSRLSQEGLISLIPSKGAVVTKFSIEDMQDIFETRALLESTAAYSSVKNSTEKTIHDLEQIIEKQEKAIGNKDPNQVYKYDTDFHHILMKDTRNKRMLNIINNLTDETDIHRLRMMASETRVKKSIDEHKQIIMAMKAKDCEKVKELLYNHLDGFCKEVIAEWITRR